MANDIVDPERIAALLDGRLDEREREQLMAQLAHSEDAFETFVDASATVREVKLPGEQVSPGSEAHVSYRLRLPQGRRGLAGPGRRVWIMAGTLAAALALLWVGLRAGLFSPSRPPDPARVVALLGERPGSLAPGWSDAGWPVARGASEPLTLRARSARIGARLVDLEVALRSGDSAAPALAQEVASLVAPLPASGPTAAVLRELSRRAREPFRRLEPLLRDARTSAQQLADADWTDVGALVEGARLAGRERNGGYFGSRTRRALDRAADHAGVPADARAALVRASAAAYKGVPNWPAAERNFAAALRSLATNSDGETGESQ